MTNSDDTRDPRLPVFASLWAAHILFHQCGEAWHSWALQWWAIVLTVLALHTALRPTLRNLVILAGYQFVIALVDMPLSSNHWVVASLAAFAIVVGVGLHLRRGRPRNDIVEAFAPAIRLCVFVLYFYVVFQKLNWDFFDPELSCGASFYAKRAAVLGLPTGTWALWVAIIGTLVIETAIPILLYIRRTRVIGVTLGVLFHVGISYTLFYNFTSMLFAFFFLFLPRSFVEDIRTIVAPRNIPWRKVRYWVLGCVAVIFGVSMSLNDQAWAKPITAVVMLSLWTLYALPLTALYLVWFLRFRRTGDEGRMFRVPNPVLLLPMLLLIFNGMCPHLGLKTETSFAMFSNLKTEEGISNHVFFKTVPAPVDHQRDLVTIVRSNDTVLQSMADQNLRLTYFTLRSRLHWCKIHGYTDVNVTFIRKREQITVNVGRDTTGLTDPHPFLQRKLLHYRPVRERENNTCVH